jgi:hypothetical protein
MSLPIELSSWGHILCLFFCFFYFLFCYYLELTSTFLPVELDTSNGETTLINVQSGQIHKRGHILCLFFCLFSFLFPLSTSEDLNRQKRSYNLQWPQKWEVKYSCPSKLYVILTISHILRSLINFVEKRNYEISSH